MERALGCAAGAGWAAVVTSRRFLRLFTVSGIQGPVLWIPGEPVTVVGRDRLVAVFHHRCSAPMHDGTQMLGFAIFDGLTGATVASGEVSALGAGASLAWAGFSDKCALSVMDGDGTLSMLARYPSNGEGGGPGPSGGGNWMPMLDTAGLRRTASDAFWPVEVHGGRLVCVPLRDGRDHPDPARRPVTTTLNLRIPMATGSMVKGAKEEELSVRGIFAVNQEKVLDDYLVSTGDADEEEIEEEYNQKCMQVDKVTLKLFSAVVQSGKVERAYDLVRRLHSEKAMDTAVQMAERVGQRKLCDRIDDLRLRKYPPIEEEEDDGPFGDDGDAASFDSRASEEKSGGSFDDGEEEEEPAIVTEGRRPEMTSRNISPEFGGGVRTPRRHTGRTRDDDEDPEGYQSTEEESPPPRESLKRKFGLRDDPPVAAAPSKRRSINPFAKKKLESPAKGIMKVGTGSSPTKLSLSRFSSFSAKSRQKQRNGKQIV